MAARHKKEGGKMKKKDYWIYQTRKEKEPWCIHMFATKDGRKIRADFEIYAEWIDNESHKIDVKDVSIVNNTQEAFLGSFRLIASRRGHQLTKGDETQIRTEINELKREFLL